ncbi:MAG TPA: cytochrome P450, partial [Steroidobacteraceae bacterium]
MFEEPRLGQNAHLSFTRVHGKNAMSEPVLLSASLSLMMRNADVHRRLRSIASRGLVQFMHRAQACARRTVSKLIDLIVGKDRADLVAEFVHPLTISMVCELLGVPQSDWHFFMENKLVTERIFLSKPMTSVETAMENQRFAELSQYFTDLLRVKAQDGTDDFVSVLAEAHFKQAALTFEEAVSNAILLFGAGHDTTRGLLTNSLLALYENDAQRALLTQNPQLIAGAIDEFLRYDSPVQTIARVALQDLVFGGLTLLEGDAVVAIMGAGNRDPAVYPDPNVLNILRRPTVKPLSFGGGVHYCLGTQLARLEATIALEALLPRLREAQLVSFQRSATLIVRGLDSLVVDLRGR